MIHVVSQDLYSCKSYHFRMYYFNFILYITPHETEVPPVNSDTGILNLMQESTEVSTYSTKHN